MSTGGGAVRRAGAAALLALVAVACDPRPYPPPQVDSFVHSTEVPPLHPAVDRYDETLVTLQGDDGLRHVLAVKVARDQAQLLRGIGGVRDVPAGTGMLLLFDGDQDAGVSPAALVTPVDMAFVSGDGEVLAVLRIDPCDPSRPCVTVDPEVRYRAVLQVRAGWLIHHGIERGARMEVGPIAPDEDVAAEARG